MPFRVRNEKPWDEADSALDAVDRRILSALQRDSSISNQLLADTVGLSPPACLKRVRRLKAAGIIERTAAQLSALRLETQGKQTVAILDMTRDQLRAAPEYKPDRPVVVYKALPSAPPAETSPPLAS